MMLKVKGVRVKLNKKVVLPGSQWVIAMFPDDYAAI